MRLSLHLTSSFGRRNCSQIRCAIQPRGQVLRHHEVLCRRRPHRTRPGSLVGFSHIAASRHSDIWGGLIDNEGPHFSMVPFKYVPGVNIVRIQDGAARARGSCLCDQNSVTWPAASQPSCPNPKQSVSSLAASVFWVFSYVIF